MYTSLPNMLTMSRIMLIPLMVAAFFLDAPTGNWVAFTIFTMAGLTDYFDGELARKRGETSGFGRFLDPVADKLLIAATLMMLVFVGRIDNYTLLPALVILCREIMVSGLREFLAELRVGMPVSRLAKWKTTFQITALGFLVVGNAAPDFIPAMAIGTAALWLAALLTLYTGYDYLRLGLKHMS